MNILQAILEATITRQGEAWVVGGAIRDRLLGLAIDELDLVLSLPPSQLPLDEWRREGVHVFWLDEGRQILRLISPAGDACDLALMQGENLQADLSRRDFTLNAMAIHLPAWVRSKSLIIDPYGGQLDLKAGQIRAVNSQSMLADPLRILRGVRLAVTKNLSITQGTMQLMQQAASTLPTVAAERLSSELESILIHPQAALGLDLLTQANVIAAILPEVKAMDDVVQNEYHQFTVGKHSRRAFAAFVEMVHSGRYLPLAIRQPFANYWQSLTTEIQAAAMLAAWLHDIGKPATRAMREGRVTFYRHEQVGAKMALDIARRLRLSSAQRTLIRRFIELHMYPAQLHASKNFGPRLIHRFYKRAGQHGPLIVVFALADYLAKAEGVAGTRGFVTRCQAVTDFLQAYFCQQAELVDPQPLLDGVELMALACLGPGPWLRVVKEELLEAQVAAEVHNKEQAANWLQGWLKKNSGRLPDQPK